MIHISEPSVGVPEIKAISKVIRTKILASGKTVEQFEKSFDGFLEKKTNHSIAVANGTVALQSALWALNLKPTDQVLTTAFSFIATANSIFHAGLKPCFADIESQTFNLSPAEVKKILNKSSSKNIKAILVVHLYGHPALMDELMDISRKKGIPLIEDCAQAHGATYDGRKVGTFGLVSTFSFYATKNLSMGEGGMICTANSRIEALIRSYINHGRGTHGHELLGYNFRTTNLLASIGLVQLKYLEERNASRRKFAKIYNAILGGIKYLTLPQELIECKHVYHQYTIQTPYRMGLMKYLKNSGIESKIFYPRIIPEEIFYKNMGYGKERYPIAESISRSCLSIPVHPGLSETQIEMIAKKIRSFFKKQIN
jgi:perosamine synthetase